MHWLDFILVACLCDSDRNLIKPLFYSNSSNNNNITTEKPRSSVLQEEWKVFEGWGKVSTEVYWCEMKGDLGVVWINNNFVLRTQVPLY